MSSDHLPSRRERIAPMTIFRAFRGLGPRSKFRIKDSTKPQPSPISTYLK
jgi:hypothetical protein